MKLSDYSELLKTLNKTCIIFDKDNIVFESTDKGIKPLMQFKKLCYEGEKLILADRIIGKGAAMMADLLNIEEIYTPIISEGARKYLEQNSNIDVFYDKEVPYIINRAKDGMCPIENAVLDLDDKHEAFDEIIKALKILQSK